MFNLFKGRVVHNVQDESVVMVDSTEKQQEPQRVAPACFTYQNVTKPRIGELVYVYGKVLIIAEHFVSVEISTGMDYRREKVETVSRILDRKGTLEAAIRLSLNVDQTYIECGEQLLLPAEVLWEVEVSSRPSYGVYLLKDSAGSTGYDAEFLIPYPNQVYHNGVSPHSIAIQLVDFAAKK